jgi:hypothetical protein
LSKLPKTCSDLAKCTSAVPRCPASIRRTVLIDTPILCASSFWLRCLLRRVNEMLFPSWFKHLITGSGIGLAKVI